MARIFDHEACDRWRLVGKVKSPLAFAQGGIGCSDSIKTPKVFCPRLVDHLLDEAAGFTDVVQQSPFQCSLPKSTASAFFHQGAERFTLPRVD